MTFEQKVKALTEEKRDEHLPCGCKMHLFSFGGFAEWVVIEECKKPDCIYRQKLKQNK
jgi:hypothetical protein